jgi:hypothetical protein
MAAPLSVLLGDSWDFFRKHFTSILVGAVVTGIVLALLNVALLTKLQPAGQLFMQRIGISDERLAELRTRIQAGDESAMAEMETAIEQAFRGHEVEMMSMGRQFVGLIAPAIAVSALVWFLLCIAYGTYIYLLILRGGDPMHLVSQTAGYFFPMLGLVVWIFLRSFIWIPIIGVIPAIILAPRFVLAGVIFIKEKKGIFESVSKSYEGTAGYWGKIVGNTLVAFLSLAVAMWLISVPFAFFSFGLLLLIKPILQMLAIAFLAIFKVKLALTIMENPRKQAA